MIMAAARRLYDHRPCVHKTVLEAFCQVPVACDQRATAFATKSLKDVHFQARRAVVAASASKYGSESGRAHHHRF